MVVLGGGGVSHKRGTPVKRTLVGGAVEIEVEGLERRSERARNRREPLHQLDAVNWSGWSLTEDRAEWTAQALAIWGYDPV